MSSSAIRQPTTAEVAVDAFAQVRPAIQELRAIMQADGADLVITSWDASEGTLELRLVLETAACAECVLPRDDLEAIVLRTVEPRVPDVRRVAVIDPRVESRT